MNTMNTARRINDYAANRNARLAIQSTHLAAFELEGPARMFFLKDMYEIANDEMNKEWSSDTAELINIIGEYANADLA
jgi:hypothetical protein